MREEKGRENVLGYKKENITLSIIIPVYNMELYLKRCLDSVIEALNGLNETAEVLIINDGSTDSSEKIIKTYCKNFLFMKLYNKENGGLSDAKNYGLERAVGRYVIFLDSDDYIDPNMYKIMLSKIKDEGADVVVCDIELVFDDPKENSVHPCAAVSRSGIFAQVIDMPMMPASWNKIVKKELYDGLTFPVGKNNEDIAVTPIVLARATKIAVVNNPFYKYYQRKGSIQNSKFSEKRFVILDTSRICIDRLREIEPEKQEVIKGSVYLHQILALAMYPIRREKIGGRYKLLKKYMMQVEKMFPDLWLNPEIEEYTHWDILPIRLERKMAVCLMKKRWYLLLSVLWTPCNMLYDFSIYIVRKIKKHNI